MSNENALTKYCKTVNHVIMTANCEVESVWFSNFNNITHSSYMGLGLLYVRFSGVDSALIRPSLHVFAVPSKNTDVTGP